MPKLKRSHYLLVANNKAEQVLDQMVADIRSDKDAHLKQETNSLVLGMFYPSSSVVRSLTHPKPFGFITWKQTRENTDTFGIKCIPSGWNNSHTCYEYTMHKYINVHCPSKRIHHGLYKTCQVLILNQSVFM